MPAAFQALSGSALRRKATVGAAGWPRHFIADALGVTPETVRNRERAALQHPAPAGVHIPTPTPPPPAPPAPREWLCRGEAAQLAGVNGNTVLKWRRLGMLPATHLQGREFRYARADLQRLIDQRGGRRILPHGSRQRIARPDIGATLIGSWDHTPATGGTRDPHPSASHRPGPPATPRLTTSVPAPHEHGDHG